MEDRVEQRRKFLYDQVGEDAFQVLRDSGLDVDAAVTNILQQQEEQTDMLETQAEFGTIDDIMTSELVYRSNRLDDVYGKEYTRRLNLMGLNGDKINGLYEQENLILSCDLGIFQLHRGQPWVRRYFFVEGVKEDDLPEFGQMTLSELILITDDAGSAFSRDHEVLSAETFNAVCKAAPQAHSYGGAQYAFAFKDRAQKLGCSPEQEDAYAKNECLLTERLKWGYHENPAWTSETTDLEQFKR
jgi:hypothetical protein|tara:strand:- start:27 stop:755 length:729 start_codon:yes stop_codon:yes gene_type:complete